MGNMFTTSSNKIEKEFENLRKELLDLTLRNQLLNFKTRAKTIKVENQSPINIFQTLVIQNKKMYFGANKKEKKEEKSRFSIWDHSPIDFSKFSDGDKALRANLTPNELQKRLFYINNQAKTMLQEQGYNILYLAVGFLEWYDNSKPKQKNYAPLILIPVTMERKKVGKSFDLSWTGEDIQTNISLKAKLKENGLKLPDFEFKKYSEVIDHYIKEVSDVISPMKGWKVNNDIALGFFSFTKFVMYNDLNPESWDDNVDLTKKELIQAIFNPQDNSTESFREEDVDTQLEYENMYQVLDADSSQIAAIQDVKAGRNLVVEGPPGTGKSQTIVNLIAELLAEGKSVLFVSEKMAALDVVKNRLQAVGLGKFVLELHSHKTRRKKFLKDLEKAANVRAEQPFNVDQTVRKLETLKKQLDDYAEVIHKPSYAVNLSPFQLYGMKESADDHFSKKDTIIPLVRFSNPESITIKDLDDIILSLESITELYQTISAENPWSKCAPKSLLPADLREIELLINDTIQALDNFLVERDIVYETFGIKKPDTLNEFRKSLKAFELIESKNSSLIDSTIIQSSAWSNSANADVLINNLETYQNQAKILDKFNDNILEADINGLIAEINQLANKKFRLFKNKQNEDLVERYYKGQVPSTKQIIVDLVQVQKTIAIKEQLETNDYLAKSYFGDFWHPKANVDDLRAITRWMKEFVQLIEEGIFSQNTVNLLSKDLFNINPADNLADYIQVGRDFENKLSKLKDKLNPRSKLIFKRDTEDVTFDQWKNQLNSWRGQLSSLHLWSQYLNTKNAAKGTFAEPFIEVIEKRNIKKEDVEPLVYGNFADALLNILFAENQELATFIGELHENRIREFQDLDKRILELNRKRIFHKLNSNIPKIFGAGANKEAQILAGEFTRKSGHLPVRKLLQKAGGVIKQIKPVFMMSPLSIAQYLDPTNEELQFDVVIFDEASQVKPQDALGAFMRGKTAVVMGDTQQLPPTSFFDQMADGQGEEEEATSLDMESILHLCKLSFPVKMLKWHYRSRHESLISVSNNQFYDDELLVYPSPSHNDSELGLKLHYNPETYYDRGTSASNRLEAKEVVKAIFEHFDTYGDTKSLGVGTFSVAQKNAILEELELERKNRPELEPLFDDKREDPFFVKNLETIQGDERDVILISVGYGYDRDGKMSLNFGPLNQEGGERRLNVLITRAREKCVVFSNFKAHDIHLTNNPPFGVKALKEFLAYAENLTMGNSIEEVKSEEPFADAIYNFLIEKGYKVDKQIGCAGFRVDLAIVDEENPGKYYLGITTDGKSYSSSKVARDRDRLREQVLTGLGWNIYHLWSTDWYRNRELGRQKLIEAIENAKIKYNQDEEAKKEQAEQRRIEAEKRAEELRKAQQEALEKELEEQNIEVEEVDNGDNVLLQHNEKETESVEPAIIIDDSNPNPNNESDNDSVVESINDDSKNDEITVEPINEEDFDSAINNNEKEITVEPINEDNFNPASNNFVEADDEFEDGENLEPIVNVEEIKEEFINEVNSENDLNDIQKSKNEDTHHDEVAFEKNLNNKKSNNFVEADDEFEDEGFDKSSNQSKSIKERVFGSKLDDSNKNEPNSFKQTTSNKTNKVNEEDKKSNNFKFKTNIDNFEDLNSHESNNEDNSSKNTFNHDEKSKTKEFDSFDNKNISNDFDLNENQEDSNHEDDLKVDDFNNHENQEDSNHEDDLKVDDFNNHENQEDKSKSDNFDSNFDDLENNENSKIEFEEVHDSGFKSKPNINPDKDYQEATIVNEEEKPRKGLFDSIMSNIKEGETKLNVSGNKVYGDDLKTVYVPEVEVNEERNESPKREKVVVDADINNSSDIHDLANDIIDEVSNEEEVEIKKQATKIVDDIFDEMLGQKTDNDDNSYSDNLTNGNNNYQNDDIFDDESHVTVEIDLSTEHENDDTVEENLINNQEYVDFENHMEYYTDPINNNPRFNSGLYAKKENKSLRDSLSNLKQEVKDVNQFSKEIENGKPTNHYIEEDDFYIVPEHADNNSFKETFEQNEDVIEPDVAKKDEKELQAAIKRDIENNDNVILTVHGEEIQHQNKSIEDTLEIIDYQIAENIGLSSSEELYSKPLAEVSQSINKIVKVESPIHIKEVINRVKSSCNLQRAGAKFKKTLNEAIELSETNGDIIVVDDFLFDSTNNKVNLRKRQKPNIDLIANEEIEKSIEKVLKTENKVNISDLAKKTSKNFGFKSTSKKTAVKINDILDKMLTNGKVEIKDDVVELR